MTKTLLIALVGVAFAVPAAAQDMTVPADVSAPPAATLPPAPVETAPVEVPSADPTTTEPATEMPPVGGPEDLDASTETEPGTTEEEPAVDPVTPEPEA